MAAGGEQTRSAHARDVSLGARIGLLTLLLAKHVYVHILADSLRSVNPQPDDEHEDVFPYRSPAELYNHQVAQGELRADAHREQVVQQLQQLHTQLQNYTPQPDRPPGFLSKVTHFYSLWSTFR